MTYKAQQFRHLVVGHTLTVRRAGYWHQALLWAFDDRGFPVVASIADGKGFYLEGFEAFLGGQNKYLYEYPSDLPSAVVLRRALRTATNGYHWQNWNCQHFVRDAHGLRPHSPDAEGFTKIIGVAVGVAAVAAILKSLG